MRRFKVECQKISENHRQMECQQKWQIECDRTQECHGICQIECQPKCKIKDARNARQHAREDAQSNAGWHCMSCNMLEYTSESSEGMPKRMPDKNSYRCQAEHRIKCWSMREVKRRCLDVWNDMGCAWLCNIFCETRSVPLTCSYDVPP